MEDFDQVVSGQLAPGRPTVSVRNLTRRFEPVRARRVEVLFSIFGGIVPGEDIAPDDDDEDVEDEIGDEQPARRPADRAVALDHVSFDAVGGTCLAIVGPPLSGKSILMRVLAGLAPPTTGQVVVQGRVAPAVLSTVRAFPRYGRVGKAIPAFAALVGISPRVARARFPEIAAFLGWADLEKRHVSLLSTSDKASLILALALHAEADVVLVDLPIPPGALGAASRARLLELKSGGALVILTGRTTKTVRGIADRVIRLDAGRIVADEPFAADDVGA